MDLRRKLARLGPPVPPSAAPPDVVAPADVVVPADVVTPAAPSRADELRSEIRRLEARASRARASSPPAAPAAPAEPDDDGAPSPFATEDTDDGPLHVRLVVHGDAARHGSVALDAALDATGEAVAALALDPSLTGFDPRRVVFLDTETTGLAGGTGTLPFLVGVGFFEDRALHVEQLFLADPERERPMLARLAARLATATALVTFNGKAFDLPLLRSRFVLARLPAPPALPHLDLLHVARRIYGARVERCQLTTLERDVLGFEREGDVAGEEIPARYVRYVREGALGPLRAVVEHNTWDVVALAALLAELGARFARAEGRGRFEPSDLVGLARTTWRAGRGDLAVAFADDASARGDASVARDAHVLAARVHHKARDADAVVARLQAALAHAPDDAKVHLELARCLERGVRDPERALAHALRAASAEDPDAHARRLARLRRLVRRGAHHQLKLPGF